MSSDAMTPDAITEARARDLFERTYGRPPEGVISAPGRVNLIGEHTDYVDGLVFPAALRVQTFLAYVKKAEPVVRAVSANLPDRVQFELGEAGVKGWGAYLAGVSWALTEAGLSHSGLDIALVSDVPTGSGLSSSAALEVAVARVWRDVDGLELDDVALVKLCKQAENKYVGVPSGIMDQFASAVPAPGEALVLDCRTLDYEVVRIPHDWVFAVVDSGASRSLAGSAYEVRVRECALVAEQLGLATLRDLTEKHLEQLSGDLLKRARHVFTENQRVRDAQQAMLADDATTFGRLMHASHASLRDDYEVSSAVLDELVAAGEAFHGCYGARLTGAGFGGCTVHLLQAGHHKAFREHLSRQAPYARVVTFL
jgi:galactokinase